MDREYISDVLKMGEYWNAIEWLNWTHQQALNTVFTTSLGKEDQVILHLMHQLNLNFRISTLDTGRFFEATYQLIQENRTRYQAHIQHAFPDPQELQNLIVEQGPNGFRDSVANRQACCRVRKVLPLKKVLKPAQIWVTGLRRGQTSARAELQPIEWDPAFEVIKVNPIWDWDDATLDHFIKTENVLVNPLHQRGYPSVGCEPCTGPVQKGADPRSGRWWWEQGNQECGIHIVEGSVIREAVLEV